MRLLATALLVGMFLGAAGALSILNLLPIEDVKKNINLGILITFFGLLYIVINILIGFVRAARRSWREK